MPDRSKLTIEERQDGDITVLTLKGEITLDDGDLAFGRYVDRLIAAGRIKLVVNLSDITYIDSSGVGMMVAEQKLVQKRSGVMKLASLTARSHHLLAMLKLRTVFEVFDDEAAAIHSFTWGPRN
jgi:anti-sigma B factor antagonist